MLFDKVKKCPVCGRRPRMKSSFFGGTRIQCKPFLKKAHVIVNVGAYEAFSHKAKAIQSWNRMASNMKADVYEKKIGDTRIVRFGRDDRASKINIR